MTREELWKLVKSALGSTRLTLSEQTVNGELDDELEGFGEDEEKNSKLVAKIANRLKRMDGNLHSEVSKEMKKNEEEAEKKRKEEKERSGSGEDEKPEYVKDLEDRLAKMEDERKQEQKNKAKNAVLDSVRNGLKEKFENAGLELNGFFAKSALSRLEIPEENADIASLVAQAETLYNADVKEAGITIDKPRSGNGGGARQEKEDEHEWDDVSDIRRRDNPDAGK